MRVSPVALNTCGPCNFYPISDRFKSDEPSLFDEVKGNSTLYDEIHGKPSATIDPAANVFAEIDKMNRKAYGPKDTINKDRIEKDPDFVNLWLQFPNEIIRAKAMTIVDRSDTDDVKMEKIQRWVFYNIKYQTDKEQYGYEELWVPPVMVLNTGKGDCEDGAFLIMSLALNSGVDPSRLRWYGGFVDAGQGAPSGSHAWVAYRRESDDEWVAVDFSYYPDLRPMNYRTPLKDDKKYVDDYFFITNQFIVSTPDSNRIREPEYYYSDGGAVPNVLISSGSLLNWYA